MNRVFTKCVAALALIGACNLAAAVPTNISAIGGTGGSFTANLSDVWSLTHTGIPAGFTDIISFFLPSTSDVSLSGNTYFLKSKPTLLSDVTGFSVLLDGAALDLTPAGSFEFVSYESTLISGLHTLTVSGIGAGTRGGGFQLQISAAPVPEPESLALLLSGLGLVGMMARRRIRAYS